jgi:hypothetical protein
MGPLCKAITLGAPERRDPALAVVNDLIDQFDQDESPFVQATVAQARAAREELLAAQPET